MTRTLILIPAYNEEQTIETVLTELLNLATDSDILVVNDGSNDQTMGLAKRFPIFVLSHAANLGYAAALQTGFQFAVNKGYHYVIQFDADGQHSPKDVPLVLEALMKEDRDLVIGSRFIGGNPSGVPFSKKMAILLFRGLIRSLTGKGVTDPTSGLRGYKRRVFETFVKPHGFPSDYPDMNFIIELLLRKYRIKEVPITVIARKHGQSMHAGLRPLIYLLQVCLSSLVVWIRFTKRRLKS